MRPPIRSSVVVAASLSAVALITVVLLPFDTITPAVPAMLYLLPIVGASVLVGRLPSLLVAVGAANALAFAFLPPVGASRVELAEDVLALVTFVVVAIVVGALKGPSGAGRREPLLDEQRAALLRGVSHDLRSPLHTIQLASSDLLAGAVPDDGTRDRLLGLVVEESRRLDRIVGNLLSLTSVHAGSHRPATERVQVDDVVDEVVQRLGRVHGRVVAVTRPDALPDVSADPVQLDQVLTNLVENALVHAPLAAVAVDIAVERGDVVVTVRDDGPGLPDPVVEAQFIEPVASATSTGLGLTVCRAIVVAHGGRLWARPAQPRGTLVSFSLPAVR